MSVDAHGYPFVARSGRLPLGPKARVGTVRVSHRRVRPPRERHVLKFLLPGDIRVCDVCCSDIA